MQEFSNNNIRLMSYGQGLWQCLNHIYILTNAFEQAKHEMLCYVVSFTPLISLF